jgi:hypothetical protein
VAKVNAIRPARQIVVGIFTFIFYGTDTAQPPSHLPTVLAKNRVEMGIVFPSQLP